MNKGKKLGIITAITVAVGILVVVVKKLITKDDFEVAYFTCCDDCDKCCQK